MTQTMSGGKVAPAAVILDFDGVVADSLDAHIAAWELAVQRIFRRPLENPASLATLATPAIASILSNRYGDPSLSTVLARTKAKILVEGEVTVPLFKGVTEFLAELAARKIPHGIASNSGLEFIAAVLRHARVTVETVVGRSDTARAKPHPAVFWECANQLRIDVEMRPYVLVFEDSLHGLKAAIAAGMIPIGVASAHTEAELHAGGAKAVCSGLADPRARILLESILTA